MTMDTIHWKEGGLGGTIYRTQGAKALVYILEPEPVTDKVASVAEELSLTLVSISGMDWNRDLSPWKAEKVFKEKKTFPAALMTSWKNWKIRFSRPSKKWRAPCRTSA